MKRKTQPAKAKIVDVAAPHWISAKEVLPPMFVDVMVWGIIEKFNVCHQAWQARRWSGWTSGWQTSDVIDPPDWIWTAPCDYNVRDVTHWMPMPTDIPVMRPTDSKKKI